MGVNANECVLPMVEVVGTLSKVKIDDTDRVHLLHLVVFVTEFHVLCDSLCHAVKDALQVVELARLLYLHQDNLTLGVSGLDVNTIEFISFCILIALALQQFDDCHLFVQQYCH